MIRDLIKATCRRRGQPLRSGSSPWPGKEGSRDRLAEW